MTNRLSAKRRADVSREVRVFSVAEQTIVSQPNEQQASSQAKMRRELTYVDCTAATANCISDTAYAWCSRHRRLHVVVVVVVVVVLVVVV